MNTSGLHTNQKLVVDILLKNGATVRSLDEFEELLEVSFQNKKDFLLDRFSSKAPYHVVKMSADKHFAKKILNDHGISTPIGHVFTSHTVTEALDYANNLYPVVLKPNWGSHGDHVQVNIKNRSELEYAINSFIINTHINEPFIIEKYHPWKEYRLFITSLGEFAVVHRECASIIGDGVSSLQKLIDNENIYRLQLKKEQGTALCPIVIDNEVYRYLKEIKLEAGLHTIPLLGEQVFLRNESNLAKGGKAIDMTHKVHPSIKQLAIDSLAAFPHLPVAGLDLLCANIQEEISMEQYVIIEINSNPGLSMHTYPTEGQAQDVANMVVNVMFPNWFN